MSKESNMVFTNNEHSKMLLSNNFNFALDKDTGVSACWGKTVNDSPEYDPISPQELIFKISNKFDLTKYLEQFIFLGNIKEQKSETEFVNVENVLTVLTTENLVSLSTLASVVLIFDDTLNNIEFNDILTFIKFVNKFSVSIIIQLNTTEKISDDLLTKIKLLGKSVQIKTDDTFNCDNFIYNINLLQKNDFILSSKLLINKNSLAEILILTKKLNKLNKDTAIKLHFNKPFVTAKQYRDIQTCFINAKFDNARIATCFNNHFNKKNPNMLMLPMDCDASRFSIYIEEDTVYPCEFNQSCSYCFDKLNTIRDFWHEKKFTKFRKYVIENNFCK